MERLTRTTRVAPIGRKLHVPAHVRRKTPSGEIRQLHSMVMLANPKERRLVLAFPEIDSGFVIPSERVLRSLIDRLEAVGKELYADGGKNIAQAVHKDNLEFAKS